MFWSRSRQEVWRKGDTSGDRQFVRQAFYDCDGDTLLFVVEQEGKGACHTGERILLPPGLRVTLRPSRDEFRALARDHTVIPVWREVLADFTTPVSAFARLVGDDDGFLLESVEHGERWSRWSFIGRNPLATLTSRGGRLEAAGALPTGRAARPGDPRRHRAPARRVEGAAARRPAPAARRDHGLPRLRRRARGRAPARRPARRPGPPRRDGVGDRAAGGLRPLAAAGHADRERARGARARRRRARPPLRRRRRAPRRAGGRRSPTRSTSRCSIRPTPTTRCRTSAR